MRYITTVNEHDYLVEIIDERHVAVDGKIYEVDFDSIHDQPVYSLLLDGKSYEALVYPVNGSWQILMHGRSYPATVVDENEKRLRFSATSGVSESSEFYLKAPMPGLVVSVRVSEGQEVQRGDVLIILESMKMQNELKAPRAGVVSRLRVQQGDSVEHHQTLLSLV